MKKLIIALTFGFALSVTTVVSASDTIQAYLFPVKFMFNGEIQEPSDEYVTLNYNGHTYVPLRFIAENMGAGVEFEDESKTVVIESNPIRFDENTLEEISFNIIKQRSAIEEKNAIRIISVFVTENKIEFWFRKYGDFEKHLTEAEIFDIKNSIFEMIGQKFPLVVNQFNIQEQSDISGHITQIDQENKRVLIVDSKKTIGQDELPEKVWVKLTEDAKIIAGPNKELKTFDDLQIGQEVKSWFVGTMLTSYPSQTDSVKIEIVS